MAEPGVIETEQVDRPNSLLCLENKTFDQLPNEFSIEPPIMAGFRNLNGRTPKGGKEWSGYLLKNPATNTLSLDFIEEGKDEAHSQQVVVEDLTGLFDQPGKLYEGDLHLLHLKLKQEDFRVEGQRPKLFLGKDLPQVAEDKLHPGVIVKPQTEFFGLAHTHPDGEAHSIGDLAMLIAQAKRVDGRAVMPVSVVIGQNNLYLLVIPTNGQIEEVENILFEGMAHFRKHMEMESEFGMFMKEHGFTDMYKALDPYLEMVAKQRKFGFYKGNLADGILKRVV